LLPSSESRAPAEDLVLLAQACELLGDILMRTLEQIRLHMIGPPPTQRRLRNAEIVRNLLNTPPAGHGQPHGFPFELIREAPCFAPAHSHLLLAIGDGPPLSPGKSTPPRRTLAQPTL